MVLRVWATKYPENHFRTLHRVICIQVAPHLFCPEVDRCKVCSPRSLRIDPNTCTWWKYKIWPLPRSLRCRRVPVSIQKIIYIHQWMRWYARTLLRTSNIFIRSHHGLSAYLLLTFDWDESEVSESKWVVTYVKWRPSGVGTLRRGSLQDKNRFDSEIPQKIVHRQV